jgi:hypothetical protein
VKYTETVQKWFYESPPGAEVNHRLRAEVEKRWSARLSAAIEREIEKRSFVAFSGIEVGCGGEWWSTAVQSGKFLCGGGRWRKLVYQGFLVILPDIYGTALHQIQKSDNL